MFEKVLIRHVGLERYVDIGSVAETLLFYGASHFHFDRGSLAAIIKALGIDTLVSLLERSDVTASFSQQHYSVLTNNTAGLKLHDFGAISLAGARGERLPFDSEIEQLVKRVTGTAIRTRTLRRLIDQIKPFKMEQSNNSLGDITTATHRDVLDNNFLTAAAAEIIAELAPTILLPSNFYFKAYETDSGLFADTNISFDRANVEYHKYVSPEHSSLNEAYIFSHIVDANFDAFLAANYMAEMVAGPMYSKIIQLRNALLLRRRTISIDDIGRFQELVFGNARALRETIQGGERTFDEFLILLDEAENFKRWIGTQNSDLSLVKTYYDELAKKSWLDKLPSKAVRFVVATTAGIGAELMLGTGLGITAGISVGAFDTFLLDRILRGWRPTQFVQAPLKQFLRAT